MRHTVFLCFLVYVSSLLFLCGTGQAHSRGIYSQLEIADKRKPVKQDAEQLLQDYRFDEAIEVLEENLAKARQRGDDTQKLEALLRQANLGADMLRGTEKVLFVDSFKVARSKVLEVLHLGADAGRVVLLSQMAEYVESLPVEVGNVAYVNDWRGRAYFSAASKKGEPKQLFEAYRQGDSWSAPMLLEGVGMEGNDEDFPFVMPDGVTIYFAAKGEESLGGYDIFVTRYNADAKQYLKAENVGMPFNSPANDYMMVIDEVNRLGWLVTDRRQKADSACVYVFIPNETREGYEWTEENSSTIRAAAAITPMAASHSQQSELAEARQRLAKVRMGEKQEEAKALSYYVIDDHIVYKDISQFLSAEARKYAEESDKMNVRIRQLEEREDMLQQRVAKGGYSPQLLSELKQIYAQLPELKRQCREMQKQMRRAELQH